jgi:O-antigen/teichoic acid export membrane protein
LTLEENLPFEMFWTWILRFKEVLGVDRAIAYTVLSRILVILGNLVTVLLMVRFLSPVEQGYYFTLLSLVALQVVFELGFSFVILQLAAHERAH